MSKYDKYKESAFTHEEMQPMIIETDMTDIVERLRLIDPTLELRYAEDVTKLHEIGLWCNEAADEIELMRHALACVVLYWDEWKDAPEDHPTALSLEEVVDMCRAHLGEKNNDGHC